MNKIRITEDFGNKIDSIELTDNLETLTIFSNGKAVATSTISLEVGLEPRSSELFLNDKEILYIDYVKTTGVYYYNESTEILNEKFFNNLNEFEVENFVNSILEELSCCTGGNYDEIYNCVKHAVEKDCVEEGRFCPEFESDELYDEIINNSVYLNGKVSVMEVFDAIENSTDDRYLQDHEYGSLKLEISEFEASGGQGKSKALLDIAEHIGN